MRADTVFVVFYNELWKNSVSVFLKELVLVFDTTHFQFVTEFSTLAGALFTVHNKSVHEIVYMYFKAKKNRLDKTWKVF